MEELDEFGIPIKKTSTPQSAKIEMDEFGIPLKKKEPAIGLGYEKPSEALRMGGLPKQEKLSQSPLKIAATTTPSVSTKKQWTQQDQKSLIEKIKTGDLTGQTPEEDDYLSRIGSRIVRGMNTLNYNLSKTPEFVYNLAAYPQNVIAETFDIPALAASADKVKQELGIQNEVADYYKDQINQLASLDDKYMGAKGSVTTLAKEGKYLDAAKLLGEQIAESLPTTAAIAASGGLGASSTAITLGGGAVFGAAKYDELADRTDLTESQKTSISFATGLTEGLFENLGTGNIGRIVKDVITKQGAAKGKEVAKGMFITAYKDALKKYMPVSGALSEGIEEAGTQFAQNAIDIYTGVDPQKKLTDGLIDAFAVGTGSGLVISSPALLSKDRNKKVAEKQVEVDEIDSEINNPNLSDDAKATLSQKRGKIMSDINDVIDEDVNEQRALPDATKREIEQIQDGLEQIGIDIENTKSEFAKKELESKRVELESRIDELTKAGTTTTDGEGTIEGAVSTGTDVAQEGLGVANEPSSEGITGEGVQTEAVPQAPVAEQTEKFGEVGKLKGYDELQRDENFEETDLNEEQKQILKEKGVAPLKQSEIPPIVYRGITKSEKIKTPEDAIKSVSEFEDFVKENAPKEGGNYGEAGKPFANIFNNWFGITLFTGQSEEVYGYGGGTKVYRFNQQNAVAKKVDKLIKEALVNVSMSDYKGVNPKNVISSIKENANKTIKEYESNIERAKNRLLEIESEKDTKSPEDYKYNKESTLEYIKMRERQLDAAKTLLVTTQSLKPSDINFLIYRGEKGFMRPEGGFGLEMKVKEKPVVISKSDAYKLAKENNTTLDKLIENTELFKKLGIDGVMYVSDINAIAWINPKDVLTVSKVLDFLGDKALVSIEEATVYINESVKNKSITNEQAKQYIDKSSDQQIEEDSATIEVLENKARNAKTESEKNSIVQEIETLLGEPTAEAKPTTKPVAEQIADLRAAEKAEYDAMANPKDKAKRKEIYDKYDKLITPLLAEQKAAAGSVGVDIASPFGVKIDMNISDENSVSIMEDIKQNPELAKRLTNREANILSKKYNAYFDNLNKKEDEKFQLNIESLRNLPQDEKTKILNDINSNRTGNLKKNFDYDKLLDNAGLDRFNLSGDINSPETYHFTSAETVKNILKEDSLFGEQQEDEGFGGISTTTNKDFDNPFFATVKEYGSMFSVVSDFSSSAVNIKLDLDKLKQDGYSAHKGNENIGTFAGEEEVRIIKKGEGQKAGDVSETEITNVSKYIKEIVLDTEKLTPEEVSEIKKLAKEKGISVSEKGKPTKPAAKAEPTKEAAKPTKTERKAISNAKIDDLAAKAKEFLRNKNLPEGTQVSGVSQNKVIDLMASTVKALVNSGIEISEAIKQVREFFEQDFDTSAVKDYQIAQTIARDELTDVAKENGFSSYREAVFAVNKYVREVGKEDVITKEEITKAKEAKNKEAEAPKKGYTSKKKQAQEGEKETTVKETGRSKSYAEGRVPVSEAYNDVVNAQKEYYETMNRKEELANAEGYLASFGNTEEGLLDAYIDMMEVFKTNPYLDPKNSIAIEILADRMFAMAIDFRDKGQTDKYNSFLDKSEKLRKEAFQAHFRAGQYTSAVAVFSRSANPDAFLIFIEGQQEQEFEKAKKTKPAKIKEYEAAVNDFYEKAKEIKKDAARQAVVSAPNSTTKVNVKLSDKLKARYEQGKARQAEALKKLGKINFFGSSGLSNEAIEAVGELVLSQFEQGIYKAATIIERIIEITEGKLTEKNIKDVYDAYKVNYKGEKLTLTELEDVLRKEEIAEKELATDIDKALEKEREKLAKIKADYEQAVVDKADALVLKRAQQFVKDQEKKVKEQEDKAKKAATAKTAEGKRPTLSDLIQRELEADSTKEQIAKELVEKGGLSEREANKLAEIYYNKYRKILKEKITSQLLKDLTPKKVKQIEAQMNALKDKPYGKTLGGMIANQVAAGALDSEILRAAFAEKYGLPNISPVQADIIRDLARKARAAKTQLGLQTANKNLLEYVNSFVKPKYGSLLGTLYYMGLLTGVSTAAVNTFGNVNGLINQSTENFVQSVIEAIQGNKGNLMSSSKPAQKILMAIANMNDSLSAAIDILIHGGGESRYSNIKKDAFGEITTEDLIVKRKDFKDLGFKKLFTTLFKLYKTPPALFIRNLPASDEGFTMANFNMEATRELRKKLYAEGYRGADLEKKVYEQVYGTTEIKAKALQEAIKELKRIGIDPANRKILANRIAKEIIANSLDEKVQNVANEVAKENTFRGKPRGMAGYLSRKIPQTWLISPFVTTPSRILEKHMNYIPLYGILRYYGYGFSNNLRKAFPGLEKDFVRKGVESSKREGELRNKQLAQVLATHALLLVFWGLSQIDWEDEKGNIVPFVDASAGYMGTDIEERKRLEELMPAYMIRIGNFKFSYKTNPLLAMIALPLGVIKDAERSFEAADYSKSAFAYNFELFNFLYESNPIEGYQDFFEGLSKSFRTIKEEMTLESIAALPVKMAADFSSNVAVDNFYKQIVDFTDPLVHEAQDLMEVIYKAFNMEKIGDLTPTHDRWGRPVKRYPGESFFPLQHLFNNNDDKKITEWEIKNGIEIPTINRKTLVLTNNTLKTEKSIKNQREELVKDYGLTSDEVKYFDEALNSDFKLLTKDEWNKMSETIRYDVFTIIKNNFENATEEYKKLYKLSVNDQQRDADIKPISKLSRPEAKKLVEILFETKRRDYINKNFTKIEQK